ncbi:MAG: hypothetical protein AB7L13_02120 [Acidimicrobiia bacterium]
MFTTGSKLYFGIGAIGVVAGIIFLVTGDNPLYGTITLFSMAAAAFFLGGVTIAFRDSAAPAPLAASAADAEGRALGAAPLSYSAWPLLGALGAAIVVLGIILDRRLFLVGVALLTLVAIEWAVQAWADRASGDPVYNAKARNKLMRPIEVPILGVVVAAIVVLPFSRVMLALGKDGAVYVFMGFATVVFLIAIGIAYAPKLKKQMLVGVLGLGAVVVVAGGIVGLVSGEREFHGGEAGRTRYVSNSANMLATVTFADEKLDIENLGIAKGLFVTVRFVNKGEERHKLVVDAGKDPKTGAEYVYETAALDHNGAQVLTFKMPNSGDYEYAVEDEGGHKVATGKITVP